MTSNRLALALVVLLSSCDSTTTEPIEPPPPGTLTLRPTEYQSWMWIPGSSEILYSTRYGFPYDMPPASLKAVDAVTGQTRTVVAALDGNRLINPFWFTIRGGYVYFGVIPSPGAISLYRAPLNGSSAAEKVLDVAYYEAYPSPDAQKVAWVTGGSIVVVDVATRAKATYGPGYPRGRITWSPDGGSLIMDDPMSWEGNGTPFHWLDLATGSITTWRVPYDDMTLYTWRDVVWNGDAPMVYAVDSIAALYSIATGNRQKLGTLGGRPGFTGASADWTSVVVVYTTCTEGTLATQGSGVCTRFLSSIERVTLATGAHEVLAEHEGPSPLVLPSSNGSLMAYEYRDCDGGCSTDRTGLYVFLVP